MPSEKKKEQGMYSHTNTLMSYSLGVTGISIGMLVMGYAALPVLAGKGFNKFTLLNLLMRQKRSLAIAAGAAATSVATSLVGALLVYLGVPFVQPTFGWQKPAKRSRTCAKLRFNPKTVTEKGPWDVIIVGSGMGGLTCASVLAQLGYKVMVLEAHEVAGGSTHDYVVDGKADWKYPSGLHYTIPASEEMLQVACGAQRPPVRFGRMGDDSVLHDMAYDRVRLTRTQDSELRVISDVQQKDELRKRFPNLLPQLERYEKLATQLLVCFPIWCTMHIFPWSIRPSMMRMFLPKVWWDYAGRSGEDVLNEIFADAPESERENVLKAQGYICGLWLDSGCSPDRVSFFMIAAVATGFPHEGGAYPEGGTSEMGETLVESIEARGGSCFVRAPVGRILIDDTTGRAVGIETTDHAGKVQLFAKHCVVSACGWRNTARLCKGSKFPEIDALPLNQGDGYVMANIGIKGSATTLGLECANMELLPVGNGLSVFDGVRKYLEDPLGVPPMEIPMMFTFPSVKDRAYKRKGDEASARESAQVLCLAKAEWFGTIPEPAVGTTSTPHWQQPVRSPEYEEIKEKWHDRLKTALLNIFPQLEGKLDMFDISTPLSIEHYLPTSSGSAIGLDTNAGVGCRFTDFNVMKLLDMKTPVSSLWLTGQDSFMIGVPLAQAAGLITAARIAGPLRTSWFLLKTIWLLVASLGYKARNKPKAA